MKMVFDGSLNFKILLTMAAARDLFWSLCGSTPRMATLAWGWLLLMYSTVFTIELATVTICLLLPEAILLVPMDKIMLPGRSGQAPCCSRHAMFSTLSPPMPEFSHPGRCRWNRGDKAGRERRSM